MKKFLKKSYPIMLASMFTLSPLTVFGYENLNNNKYETYNNNYNEQNEKIILTQTHSENVRRIEGWTPYFRVSNNMTTGNTTGTISTNTTNTVGTTVNGNISGLGISTNNSVSSQIGISFNVPRNSSVHIGHRVRTRIETGTRVVTVLGTGIQTRNDYTVSTPLYGEYALINTRTGNPLMVIVTEIYES